jgi:hypothetical protein
LGSPRQSNTRSLTVTRVPSCAVTLSYVLDPFDLAQADAPAAAHYRSPVAWYLAACQRRTDLPGFTFAGDGRDRWQLTFAVEAANEDQALDDAGVLAAMVWPNRNPVDVSCSPQ